MKFSSQAQAAKRASRILGRTTKEQRTNALLASAKLSKEDRRVILDANKMDLSLAEQNGLDSMRKGILTISDTDLDEIPTLMNRMAGWDDPIGKELRNETIDNGLQLIEKTVPLGVVLMICEARPSVVWDTFAMCLRSGNALIICCSEYCIHTSAALVDLFSRRMSESGLPEDAILLASAGSYEDTYALCRMEQEIDLAILRGGHASVAAIKQAATTALACEYIPESRMGEGIGYLGLGNTIAQAVAPGIGLGLAGSLGYRYTFLCSSLFMLAGFGIFALLWVQEAPRQAEPGRIRLEDIIAVSLLPLALLNGLFSLSNGAISNFIIMHAETNHILNASLYFSVAAAAMLLIRPVAGGLNDRRGLAFVLVPAYLSMIVGVLLIARMTSLPMLLVAAVFIAVGQGSGQPSIQTECVKRLGPARRGVAISTYYIFATEQP